MNLKNNLTAANKSLANNDINSALKHVQEILTTDPQNTEALCIMSDICIRIAKLDEALQYASMAYEIDPKCNYALQLAGNVFINKKEYEQCISMMHKLLALEPKNPIALWAMSYSLYRLDRVAEAYDYIVKAIRTGARLKSMHLIEGTYFLKVKNQFSKALECFFKDLEHDPDSHSAYLMISNAYSKQGRLEEAYEYSVKQIEVYKQAQVAHDNIIMYLHYLPDIDPQQIIDASRYYYECCYPGFYEKENHKVQNIKHDFSHLDLSPDKKDFRIGFVSGDLKKHALYYWLREFFKLLGQDYTTHFYCNNFEDEATEDLKQGAHKWVDITRIDDEKAAQIIKDDNIDILFDLSGHTALNRLGVFVRRPAPLQVTWVGQSGPHGIPQLDYMLSDGNHNEDADDWHYIEKIYKLPHIFSPLSKPSTTNIEIEDTPCLTNGYTTFGCFNNFLKVHKGVIELYAKVLNRVENSKILLKTKVAEDKKRREEIDKIFTDNGVSADRVIWEEHARDKKDYLRSYNKIDISLDPYPLGGSTTSVDTIWMGTPIITIRGIRMSHRMASVFLKLVGHEELVAHDFDEYIEKAAELSADPERINRYKHSFREKIENSPIFDVDTFLEDFKTALNVMWKDTAPNYH